MNLTNEQLLSVNGGANFKAIFGIVTVVVSFIAGIIDGYVHPKACSLKGKRR